MIQLYSGVPGAGKTYKMVEDVDAFLIKEPDVNLVSNIRNLKLPHIDFDDLLLQSFPDKTLTIPQRIELFFDYENQRKLNEDFQGPMMYVLDECQLFFPRRTSLPKTEAYLQRHRHLGHFIYLATQSTKLININIVALIEIEFYAVRRTISFFGEMHYRVKSPQSNQIIKKLIIRPKKRIFELYKSFEVAEISKPDRSLLFRLWPLLLLPIAFFFFYDRVFDTQKRTERILGKPLSTPDVPGLVSPVQSVAPSSPPAAPPEPPKMERVQLSVVQFGSRKITVDPETNAIVDVSEIKQKVICVNGKLTCYYDRLVNSPVKLPQNDFSSTSMSSARYYVDVPQGSRTERRLRELSEAGPGSFISVEMIPSVPKN